MEKKAIIHVENSEGVVEFARFLADAGWTISSANKTEELLRRENIPVVKENALTLNNFFVNDLSGLIQKIVSSKNDNNYDYMIKKEDSFSLICINMNPIMKFDAKIQDIEQVLNPSVFFISNVLRNACVNYKNLLILTDPADYEEAMIQLRTDNISSEFRIYLAAKALNMISAYDGGIASSVLLDRCLTNGKFMNYLMFPFVKQESYSTGTNPHQLSCLYRYPVDSGAVSGINKFSGAQVDYNSISDSAFAWEVISLLYSNLRTQYTMESTNCDGYNFTTQCTPLIGTVFTIAVKYKSIIGASLSSNVLDSIKNTYNFDSNDIDDISLGCSAVIDEQAAKEILKTNILTVIAPGFTTEAKEILLENPKITLIPIVQPEISSFDLKMINGGLVFQTKDKTVFDHWNVKTKNRPNQFITDEMAFGMILAMSADSHSAVLIKNNTIAGISQGCISSIKAIDYAIRDAIELQNRNNQQENVDNVIADVLVCDTQFPLTDSLKELISKGLSAIIQTGGHQLDEELIKYCDERGVSLVFTGMTHISY